MRLLVGHHEERLRLLQEGRWRHAVRVKIINYQLSIILMIMIINY